MTGKEKNIIIIVLSAIILAGVWFWGYYTYPRTHPPPVTVSDTVTVVDTVQHHIIDKIPYYIVKTDSVVLRDTIFMYVDTAVILRDYFAIHYYDRQWKDSLISVTLRDEITENKPFYSSFSYQIFRPQTVVNNTTSITSYAKYLYLGTAVNLSDINSVKFGVYGALPKSMFGIAYSPYMKSISVTAAFKIVKFK